MYHCTETVVTWQDCTKTNRNTFKCIFPHLQVLYNYFPSIHPFFIYGNYTQLSN